MQEPSLYHDRISKLVPRPVKCISVLGGLCWNKWATVNIMVTFHLIFWGIRKIVKSYYQLHHVCLPVRMEQLGSHWMDFDEIWAFFFGILLGKVKFHYNLGRIMGSLHEYICSFMIISRWILRKFHEFWILHVMFTDCPLHHWYLSSTCNLYSHACIILQAENMSMANVNRLRAQWLEALLLVCTVKVIRKKHFRNNHFNSLCKNTYI